MEWIDSLTVGQVLERGANLAPDKTAVVDGDERMTYRDLNAFAEALELFQYNLALMPPAT